MKRPDPMSRSAPLALKLARCTIHQALDHLALALTHTRHVDLAIIFGDSKLRASPEIGGHLRTVDNIFARQTGDIRARATDILSLYNDDPFSLFSHRPSKELASLATAQNHKVVFICLRSHKRRFFVWRVLLAEFELPPANRICPLRAERRIKPSLTTASTPAFIINLPWGE